MTTHSQTRLFSNTWRKSYFWGGELTQKCKYTHSQAIRDRGRPIIGADIKHFTDYRYRPF